MTISPNQGPARQKVGPTATRRATVMARRTRQTLKIAVPTRLPATDERYRSIASMAVRQMRLSELDPERAIQWLRANSKTVQYVTLRLYRAAIRLSLTEELERQNAAGDRKRTRLNSSQ